MPTIPALAAVDSALIATERAMIRPEGLPRRPWYRHELYAPGLYTGYGVKTLPAVREAIEQHRWDEARAEIPILAATVEAVTAQIDRATELLRR